MEHIIKKEQSLLKTFLPAILVAAIAFAMIAIVYGADSIAPGVHDAFHDVRHTIGMPCH